MRIMIFYDLPFDNKIKTKEYSQFRNNLIKEGFHMVQYSIYSKLCYNQETVNYVIKRVEKKLPKMGNIRILTITEKQYQNIKVILGSKSDNELLINDRRFIEI